MSPVEEGTSSPEKHAARIPISSRLQSPTFNPFPLGSNDDELEREQARAARAASIRRKSVLAAAAPTTLPSLPSLLERDQIMDLLQNCLKLASENKINQKNTWELNLIDHLSEIIQSKSEEDDAENNFQKASCSLEAGVKIYSLRVDSLHSEAYKVLGGINRAGTEENNENVADKNHAHGRTEQEGLSRKDIERKLSPLSTLEASFEALNMKKIDVAFSVDPLYHQTSAQFDEGGAKGLLLINLGVYGNCHVLFDSFEVPEKFILNDSQNDKSELIDLSFAKDSLDQMMINMPKKDYISPTLRDIMDRFDENNHKQQNLNVVEEQPAGHGETDDIYHTELGDTSFGDVDLNASDHDDHISVIDDNSMIGETSFSNHLEETGDYSFQGFGTNVKIEEITDFLSYGLGFTSKTNEWAGPDYWKYKKSKGLEHVPYSVEKQEQTTSKTKVKKSFSDFEFMKSLEKDFSNIFQAPKNPKSLLLPTNRASCKFSLPEDFHYKPESLAKLFLLPDVMV
ncbi:Condensin complex subunit 2 [Platanthera guangdongensis]|uniref:Condensin complex subunit 2 n=1 Tax=Platanthera guangdongensis TaxID=2320717 RepID=A0ABR2M590_9ASPA